MEATTGKIKRYVKIVINKIYHFFMWKWMYDPEELMSPEEREKFEDKKKKDWEIIYKKDDGCIINMGLITTEKIDANAITTTKSEKEE